MPEPARKHKPTHELLSASRKTRDASYDKSRPNAYQRGYTAQWSKARQHHLAKEPFCRHCKTHGVLSPGVDVDHIVPHRGDRQLFWDRENWQSLCKPCHARKTRTGL